MSHSETAERSLAELWDVIVIGTGMGGAAVGFRLAQAGQRVLFVEKGRAATAVLAAGDEEDPERRRDAGHWPQRVLVDIEGVTSAVHLPLGSGVGGSTILYAAALERFSRSDVEAMDGLPHPTGGWPVPWKTWTRYYEEAERLLHVRGHGPPGALLRPVPASLIDQAFDRHLRGNGLAPYSLHVGIAYKAGCKECGGRRCPHTCKSDAATCFVGPALRSGHATLLVDTEAIRIEADAHSVTGVTVTHGGKVRLLRARSVVLAAGAYHSPALLLRSASSEWPAGLANANGLVGRFLMFHANEWLAVWPRYRLAETGPRKTIGFRDHYAVSGTRLGSVQSTGLTASFGNITTLLHARLAHSRWRRLPGLRLAAKLVAHAGVRLFGTASMFVMLVEDLGYYNNRVELDAVRPDRIRVSYGIAPELRARAQQARGLLRNSFRGLRAISLQRDVEINLGHACGTCRFGVDPAASVLDADCRAHGVANLYVVDASFMPTSGGANPALTIAANALRVGDLLAARLREDATRSAAHSLMSTSS